jgi:glycosyltransferase involved in cell wall biosynthesis
MMGGLRVSVVICAYTMRRWDQLAEAVASVRGQTRAADEVIVVVDYCDTLLERAADALGPDVQVLANSGPRGLSGARNSGVAVATGDVVAFLDDDATAEPDWLDLLSGHYAEPSVVGVGGLIVPRWEVGPPRWLPPEFGWVVGCSYTGQPTVTAVVRNPIGANMSFRREPVLTVGGFATSVGRVGADGLGCEETELSIRLAQHDQTARILHEPGATVHHLVPAERARWAYFRRRCWAEGLSKAEVSRLSDPRRALASERIYAFRTVPAGAARDIVAAVRHRDAFRLARAVVGLTGLAVTAAGYLRGRTRPRRSETVPTRPMTVTTTGRS